MTGQERQAIRDIQSKVVLMLQERRSLDGDAKLNLPSNFWKYGASNFSYMMNLPEQCYQNIRLHTYHFTGDVHINYMGDPEEYRKNSKADIGPHLINELENGIGYKYPDGRFLSNDSLRFQNIINSLYSNKVIQKSKQRQTILDIGAGYGGLIHHLRESLGNATCVIIDLPETLLFSASYLTMHNPKKKIYVYDSNNFSRFISSPAAKTYDFILVPNYATGSLIKWEFDLVLNINSMQEMRTEQVEAYLKFIKKTCRGKFYSRNLDCFTPNKELTGVTDLLKKYFKVQTLNVINPPKREKWLYTVARKLGLLNPIPAVDMQHSIEWENVCT